MAGSGGNGLLHLSRGESIPLRHLPPILLPHPVTQRYHAFGCDLQRAHALAAQEPAALQAVSADQRAQLAGDMKAAFAPVKAWPAVRPLGVDAGGRR